MKRALLPLLLLSQLAPAASALPNGLVSYWAADGNALDSAGNSHGALSGDSTYGAGRFGQAFSFSGGGGGFFASLNGEPLGSSDRSLEAWVNLDAYHLGGDSFAGYGQQFSYTATYSMGGFNGPAFFSQWGMSFAGGSISTNAWHHVAAVTLAGLTTLYVNGNAVGSASFPMNTPDGTGLRLGMGYPGENYALDGRVDDVALWSRALSASEIQDHYLHGISVHVPAPELASLLQGL